MIANTGTTVVLLFMKDTTEMYYAFLGGRSNTHAEWAPFLCRFLWGKSISGH
jgi:hypothetical protein